jgi:tRNA(Ile)-lysidine synthetase-like protein
LIIQIIHKLQLHFHIVMDHLTSFWFDKKNQHCWFNSTPETDIYVLENTKQYCEEELSILGRIIFHDQIIRHHVRHNNLDKKIINDHNIIAIGLTNYLLESNEILSYKPIEQCFILMPLRHSPLEKDRERTITIIEEYLEKDQKNPDYLRFYQASLERVRNPELIKFDSSSKFPQELVCSSSIFKIDTFLDTYYMINQKDIMIDKFSEGFLKTIPLECPITVSISGGSDSMLCLFVAKKLGYDVIAMMIDYGNRNEHATEIDFVSWFCDKLEVPFYLRKIKELKRSRDGTRDFYEKVTKNIRFNSYKFLKRPVVLGHNMDDCFENCITNMMSQRSKENLYGMSPESEQMGVKIYRPILAIPKKNIVIVCNHFKIPFLLDSTPKWSRRGQIRDIIVPAMNQFDINLIPRIMEFCQESSQSCKDYQSLLESYPIKKDSNGKNTYTFDLTQPFNTNIRFWQGMINKITDMTESKVKRIRISTIESMIQTIMKELINQHNINVIKVTLSVDLVAFVSKDRMSISFVVQ